MKKLHGTRKHLEESVPLVEQKIAVLKEEIAELTKDVDIVTIGLLVKKQVDLIRLEEKLVQMLKELNG